MIRYRGTEGPGEGRDKTTEGGPPEPEKKERERERAREREPGRGRGQDM